MTDPYNIAFWFHNITFLDGMNNWRVLSFGMLRWYEFTEASEERTAPIFRSNSLFYYSD
jgi:hypothetical protein